MDARFEPTVSRACSHCRRRFRLSQGECGENAHDAFMRQGSDTRRSTNEAVLLPCDASGGAPKSSSSAIAESAGLANRAVAKASPPEPRRPRAFIERQCFAVNRAKRIDFPDSLHQAKRAFDFLGRLRLRRPSRRCRCGYLRYSVSPLARRGPAALCRAGDPVEVGTRDSNAGKPRARATVGECNTIGFGASEQLPQ